MLFHVSSEMAKRLDMDADTIRDESASIEDVSVGEMEAESKNIDSQEVASSGEDVTREVENAAEILTRVELDLACSSEKIDNLDILVLHVAARENDFEDFVLEESVSKGTVEKALEYDFLSGILDSEVGELDSSLATLRMEILRFREDISSFKQLGETFEEMEEKLQDCEESLKNSFEHVSEIKMQSANFQRILLSTSGDENWKDGKELVSFGNGGLLNLNTKIKMLTPGKQRRILRMLEKSLARELDLEKKLAESRETEEDLKLRLQQEVSYIEEGDEAEISWERLFEAEYTAEILLGISKELLGQTQIVERDLNGSVRREGELRSKLQDLAEQLKNKDNSLQNSESSRAGLMEKVNSLENQIKELESQPHSLKDSSARNQNSSSKIYQTETIIDELKEKSPEAEKRALCAKAVSQSLREFTMEPNKNLKVPKIGVNGITERVKLFEKQLKDSETKRQWIVATAKASQEKQNMLDCTNKDMETLIEDPKSEVSKSESQTESAEENYIILSESDADLREEIKFQRGRIECLEASLHQAEEAKEETARYISLWTELIADLVMDLALERERLHKQVAQLLSLSYFDGHKLGLLHYPPSSYLLVPVTKHPFLFSYLLNSSSLSLFKQSTGDSSLLSRIGDLCSQSILKI